MKAYITELEIYTDDEDKEFLAKIKCFDGDSYNLTIDKIVGWDEVYFIGDVLKRLQNDSIF